MSTHLVRCPHERWQIIPHLKMFGYLELRQLSTQQEGSQSACLGVLDWGKSAWRLLRDFYDWDLSEIFPEVLPIAPALGQDPQENPAGIRNITPATWHNFVQLHFSVCLGHEVRKGPAQATSPLRARSAHKKIRECMLCPLVFLGTI